ncbi:MAG: outer membrane beta-barrel protein [Rickettsiales bacterium]|nr:outer membrane beta-barrel protein [Rickettsiales bacterium]
MKLKILLTIVITFISFNAFAAVKSNTTSNTTSPTADVTESTIGVGLSVGKRLNLSTNILSDIFFDEYDEENKRDEKTKDHIFTEIEIFGNYNISGEINQDYGIRLNLGYEIEGFRLYPSFGYLKAKLDYIEDNSQKQSISESSPFVGFGIGYDITKNIGVRMNYSIYSIDFKPKNSVYDNVEVDVSTVNLNLAVHF